MTDESQTPPESVAATRFNPVLAPTMAIVLFTLGLLAGVPLAIFGLYMIIDNAQTVFTVLLAIFLFLVVLSVLVMAFRQTIWSWMFRYGQVELDRFARPLSEVARYAAEQKVAEATTAKMEYFTMLKHCFLVIFTFGLVLCATAGQAQHNNEPYDREQVQTDRALPILRVDIIEDQASVDAREFREREAAQREIDDLIAQQGMNAATQAMNEATQKMADFAYAQTWLVGIGTALLFVTLALTWQANLAARKAVEETRRIGEAQVRAYVSWGGATSGAILDEMGQVTNLLVRANIKNTGQSPATLRALYSDLQILFPADVPNIEFELSSAACNDEIGAGNPFGFINLSIPSTEWEPIYTRQKRCYLLGWASYRDVFSDKEDPDRILKFCFEIFIVSRPENFTAKMIKDSVTIMDLHSVPNYSISPRAEI